MKINYNNQLNNSNGVMGLVISSSIDHFLSEDFGEKLFVFFFLFCAFPGSKKCSEHVGGR